MPAAALRNIVAVIALAAAGWAVWHWWFPGDEAQIREVLERIADGVSAESSESDMGRLARAAGLRSDFDPDVVVDAGPPFTRVIGRDAVIATAARLNGTIRNLEISFDDVQIDVSADRTQATAALTARARFDEGSGGRGSEARELDVLFRRIDGRWVVAAVALMRPLRPVTGR